MLCVAGVCSRFENKVALSTTDTYARMQEFHATLLLNGQANVKGVDSAHISAERYLPCAVHIVYVHVAKEQWSRRVT